MLLLWLAHAHAAKHVRLLAHRRLLAHHGELLRLVGSVVVPSPIYVHAHGRRLVKHLAHLRGRSLHLRPEPTHVALSLHHSAHGRLVGRRWLAHSHAHTRPGHVRTPNAVQSVSLTCVQQIASGIRHFRLSRLHFRNLGVLFLERVEIEEASTESYVALLLRRCLQLGCAHEAAEILLLRWGLLLGYWARRQAECVCGWHLLL